MTQILEQMSKIYVTYGFRKLEKKKIIWNILFDVHRFLDFCLGDFRGEEILKI